jgi:hypothetical protein
VDHKVTLKVPSRNKEIRIELEDDSPPSGKVLSADQEELTFVGWLGLIRALSDLFEAPLRQEDSTK